MRSPGGVVVSALTCQTLHSGLIHTERAWLVLQLGAIALCYYYYFSSESCIRGWVQAAMPAWGIVNQSAKKK